MPDLDPKQWAFVTLGAIAAVGFVSPYAVKSVKWVRRKWQTLPEPPITDNDEAARLAILLRELQRELLDREFVKESESLNPLFAKLLAVEPEQAEGAQ